MVDIHIVALCNWMFLRLPCDNTVLVIWKLSQDKSVDTLSTEEAVSVQLHLSLSVFLSTDV